MFNGTAPIGVFDSGLGGMSVAAAIRKRLPDEAILYVADSGFAPYGEKTDAFIKARSRLLAHWLLQRGAKALVVACNTATTHAITQLRGEFAVPVIGVEPGVKPAVQFSKAKVVGVLATAATLRSKRLQELLTHHGQDCRFVCQAGHGLVELIEQGIVAGASVYALLEKALRPMADAGADTLVLGSTHYAFLMPSIARLFGERFQVIETGGAVARRVDDRLTACGLRAQTQSADPALHLYSTAAHTYPLQRLAQALSLTASQVATVSVALS
ncbi:MAG: glutamate racemase [Bordetella sp.]|uniref:glutamate racemase n=1 Tax=Bordetella sp. TaxID=28081 RepID=UPI003F7CC4C8